MSATLRRLSLGGAMGMALAAAGCGHVPVSTMWALRSFDSLSADPAALRAAVLIPDGLLPRPDGVKVTATWGKKGQPATERKVEILLQEIGLSSEPGLAGQRRAGARLFAFRVAPDDVPRMRALQQEVMRAKAEKRADYGSIGVSADACRVGELPQGPILMTTLLKTAAEAPYLVLLDGIDLRSLAGGDAQLDDRVPPCGKLPLRAGPVARTD